MFHLQRAAELLRFAITLDNIRAQMRLIASWGASIVTLTSDLIESMTFKMAAFMCDLKAASQMIRSEGEELTAIDISGMCFHFAVSYLLTLIIDLLCQICDMTSLYDSAHTCIFIFYIKRLHY